MENTKINYGYACINLSVKNARTNRSMIRSTFDKKGITYASELALKNLRGLVKIISWNNSMGIRFYRMSSDIFPWMSEYDIKDLPDFKTLEKLMMGAGSIAGKYDQRLTFHPGPFNMLASPDKGVVERTVRELNQHGEIMDYMGLFASQYNKINIHIGTGYGDKEKTIDRFIQNLDMLDESTRSRLTVENDDCEAGYTATELVEMLNPRTKIPIVFDYLHHACNPGGVSEADALAACVSTWPDDITPVVHASSSRKLFEGNGRESSHADHIHERIDLHGHVADIMIEAKAKDMALLRYLKTYT